MDPILQVVLFLPQESFRLVNIGVGLFDADAHSDTALGDDVQEIVLSSLGHNCFALMPVSKREGLQCSLYAVLRKVLKEWRLLKCVDLYILLFVLVALQVH